VSVPPGDDDGSVEALARQLAGVRRTVADLIPQLAGQRGQLAEFRRRLDDAGLDGLAGQVAALAAQAGAAGPAGPRVTMPRWDQLSGQARAEELRRLARWVDQVLVPGWVMPAGPYQLPSCWAAHEAAVWELSVLAVLWRQVWDRPRPGPAKDAAEWCDRWLPGVMRRLAAATRDCTARCIMQGG
jgi:hypothetical protein